MNADPFPRRPEQTGSAAGDHGSSHSCPAPQPAMGLFDFQVNGFAGVDFQQDDLSLDALRLAVRGLKRHRTAQIFATLITDRIDRLCRRLARFEALRGADGDIAGMIAGYHLEGPWLSPEPGYCGAHQPAHMHPPTWEEFEQLQAAAGGRIRLVTLAPELPGSCEFIRALRAAGVHVSLGHTNADEAQIDAAISAGARFCTHLGNAVPPLLPRHDNIVFRLLARDELIACFIPDGVHLPPRVLRSFVRAKPPGQCLFTTDAMAGAGAPPGNYTLGEVNVCAGPDGVARHPAGGFAGSLLTPDVGVTRTARFLGLSLSEAARLWSEIPAGAFGLAPSLLST